MAKQTFPLRRADDVAGMTQVLGERNKVARFQPYRKQNANINAAAAPTSYKPRYSGAGATADWHGGNKGNDVDVADASQAIVDANGTTMLDYEPRHQEERSENMVPSPPLTTDLGKDYAALVGQTGREGVIEPDMPYPAASTAEVPAAFRESNYIPYPPPGP